jgi:phenylacetate-CoA ligase
VRAAVVAANFQETALVCVFERDSVTEMWKFGPDLIAAPLAVLLRWAEAESDGLKIPAAHRAIVAFTGVEGGAIAESTRDVLWQAFEVPVFEQWLGSDGCVLGWECEAHEGLHVAEQNLIVEQGSKRRLILTSLTDCRRPMLRVVAGFTGRLVDEPCACGQPGTRLCDISSLTPQGLSTTAAAGQCYG